jgi:hypothetical protein
MDSGWVIARYRNAALICGKAWVRIFRWLCILLAVIGVPCLPVLLRLLRGQPPTEEYLLTSVILSATYFFGTVSWFYRFFYAALFSANALISASNVGTFPSLVHSGGTLLIALAFLHAAERFGWHVVNDYPFPEIGGRSTNG